MVSPNPPTLEFNVIFFWTFCSGSLRKNITQTSIEIPNILSQSVAGMQGMLLSAHNLDTLAYWRLQVSANFLRLIHLH